MTRILLQPLGVRKLAVQSLERELAFYIHAPSVRVVLENETGHIAIEVTHPARPKISLRDFLENEQDVGTLSVPAGLSIEGNPVWFSLAKAPHLLVAGTTGSGKSTFMHQLVMSLIYRYGPSQVLLQFIDPKQGLEFGAYRTLPHLFGGIAVTPEESLACLLRVVKEMEARGKKLREQGCRSIDTYLGTMPRLIVFIDELVELLTGYLPEMEETIVKIARLGRAAGIHLVVATQHPSRDVVTPQIKANITARVSFAVSSAVDSKVILDRQGAEQLQGEGDALMLLPGHKEKRVTTCLVTPEETDRTVEWYLEEWPGRLPGIPMKRYSLV